MRFVPPAVTRTIASQVLQARKHSPELLLGAGVVSMMGSTVMACRATLKLEEVLNEVESNRAQAHEAKRMVEAGEVSEGTTYTDKEMSRDMTIITVRGVVKIVKLYAPAVVLGGVGVVCLTKSHMILKDRNAALTAAYVAVDAAFKRYRARVVERYGEELDRAIAYESEEVNVIDEETGKLTSETHVVSGDASGYARWFDETNNNWTDPASEPHYNSLFLRNQQNWANDMLRARGHLFLNEVYSMVGLTHTSAGSVVGWVYERNNDRGDNYVDFGCWDDSNRFDEFFNGRDGGILLDFNVDGPIWDLIDERQARTDAEQARIERNRE